MKKIKFTLIVFVVLVTAFFATHCQHEDSDTVPVVGPDPIERGDQVLSCTNCNTNPGGAGNWYHDKAHSNVMWETQYKEFGSLLTGRFDSFFMTSFNFDEANPQNISFEGYVWLNSVNTSEPARDDGCLLTSFGTTSGLTDEAQNRATLKTIAGTGRYSTTDAGFLIDAEFTLLGITKPVTVKMFFAPKYDIGTAFAAGFNSEFEIKKVDFLPNDTNIGDVIKITINSLMRQNK